MATMHVNSLMLLCDGCEKPLKEGQTFQSAVEARAVAYGEGWRFPNQLSKRTQKPIGMASDVCPDCLPSWKPQVYEARAGYQRRDGQKS